MDKIINKGASFISGLKKDDLKGLNTNDLLLIAEIASGKAIRPENSIFDFEWGMAAINIYNIISELSNNPLDKASSMYLIINGIKSGNVPNQYKDIYNIQMVLNWFWDRLTLSLNEIKTKNLKWKELSIDEMRILSNLKIKLGVIKEFYNDYPNEIPQSIIPWLEIRDSLLR